MSGHGPREAALRDRIRELEAERENEDAPLPPLVERSVAIFVRAKEQSHD